ncbi:hypothetical protein MKW94_003017 [Papaver nudicaule]|uniref:Beta-glucosidase n=1 Tax=Papaver nudicaule TaxID=74823 RepID=A0AA41V8G9_PAPNU|nr:hypothetical protein [Papaver nudicaule]
MRISKGRQGPEVQNHVKVYVANGYKRADFPPNFVFGSGSSLSGAANEDGKTLSILGYLYSFGLVSFSLYVILEEGYARRALSKKAYPFFVWKHHCNNFPIQHYKFAALTGKLKLRELPNNGDIAANQYHRYKEDVKLMVDAGLDAYRFSISWSRLIPNGRGPINPKGLEYYNNLIDELTSHGIQAHVTLLHSDLPQALEDEYEGWLSRKIVKQHGLIGFNNLFGYGFSPVTNSTENIAATRRANDFYLGWFAEPFVFGDYPESMKRNVGSRLPSFTPYEAKLVKGSCDFFGVNHYASIPVKDNPENLLIQPRDYILDMAVQFISTSFAEPVVFCQRLSSAPRETSMNDTWRVNYLKGYVGGLLDAVRNGYNTKGYFTWSFLDSFDLLDGCTSNFGFYHIDLVNDPDLKRYPKLSAHWYSDFLKGGNKRISTISPTIDGESHFSQ